MAANYSFATGASGTFTIHKKTLTVTPDPQTVTYGQGDPAFTLQYGGFEYSDNATSLDTQAACSVPGTSPHPAGMYTISCVPGTAANYVFDVTATAVFTVNKAQLTITASSHNVTYGDAAPAVSPGYSGFVLTETASNLTAQPTCSTTYTQGSPVATYPTTCSGATSNNYEITYVPGTVTVAKADTVTTVTCPASVTFTGAPIEPCSARATGAESLDVPVAVTYTANVNAGTAQANAAYAGDANHNGSTAAQVNFTIDKAPSVVTVTCTVGAPFIYTGAAQTPCTAEATGVALTPVDVSTSLVYSNNTNAGSATADANYAGDQNHQPSTGSGGFTIGKAASTVTINCPASVIYNGAAQGPCTASYSGAGNYSGSVTPSYMNNVGPGIANVSASHAGDANHEPSSASTTFAITNVPVSTVSVTSATISENGTANLTISFTDPDGAGQSHTGTVNWGDGAGPQSLGTIAAGTTSVVVTRTFLDDDPTATPSDAKTVTVSITDGVSTAATGTGSVTIQNVAPTIASLTGAPTAPIQINTPVSITATFADVGTMDTHICKFNWDDTTPATLVPGLVTETNGSGTCAGTKSFTQPGVYSIAATVTDDDTGSATLGLATQYVVVFDPSGGFVTGGGWIMSPEGACRLAGCTNGTTGRANFGFVSKYKKGSNIPEGETQFQFQAGNLNFHSSSYDVGSLVVQGYKAQYKGLGQVNGQAGYKFVLTAYDGDINGGGNDGFDKFRMKIVRLNGPGDLDDEVVYDNRIGTSDDIDNANPMQIAGGSINIQKAK
jgi:hypothetical protein